MCYPEEHIGHWEDWLDTTVVVEEPEVWWLLEDDINEEII